MALLGAASVGLWACDKGANAPARSHSADEGGASSPRYESGGSYRSGDNSRPSYNGGETRRDQPREAIPLVDGVPMWSDNRKHTAEENADYHFHHDGPDFGASDEKDYVAKVHHFIEHPPEGVQTVSPLQRRQAALRRQEQHLRRGAQGTGAPRTMFKPHAGEAYWKEQQEKAASGDDSYGGRGSYRRSSGGGDEG